MQTATSASESAASSIRLLGALALAVAVVGTYLPALRNGFVNWDDDICVVDNEAVTLDDGLWRIWSTRELPEGFPNYPLVFSSYWLEHRLWGANPTGYHATNVLLHGLNTALVFLLVEALGCAPRIAALTAVLFGIHPMQVESVAWISERKNVLSAFFSLVVFLAYRRQREGGGARWYGIMLLAFVCALLSKTAAVVVPVSLLLADRFQDRRWTRAGLLRVAPMLALSLLAGMTTATIEHRPYDAPLVERVFVIAGSLWFYVTKLLVPVRLLPVYPQWSISSMQLRSWVPLLLILVTVAVVYRWVPQWRARWGLAHFAVVLLPVSGLRAFGFNEYSFVADHHVYFACIGFFLALALGCDWLGRHVGRLIPVGVAVVVVCLLVATWRQLGVWGSSVTLWSYVVAGNPDAIVARNNLGLGLINEGRLEEAAEQLHAALALSPASAEAHINLALISYRQGNLDAAEGHCREALALRPRDAEYHKNLALVLQQRGQLAEAASELRSAQALHPRPTYHYLLGTVLVEQGGFGEAIVEFQRALALDAEREDARTDLGRVLLRVGRVADATAVFSESVRRQPRAVVARYNLSLALSRLGRFDEAARQLEAALQVQPDFAPAREQLQALHARPASGE